MAEHRYHSSEPAAHSPMLLNAVQYLHVRYAHQAADNIERWRAQPHDKQFVDADPPPSLPLDSPSPWLVLEMPVQYRVVKLFHDCQITPAGPHLLSTLT